MPITTGLLKNSSRTPEAKTNASIFDGDVLKAAQSWPIKKTLTHKIYSSQQQKLKTRKFKSLVPIVARKAQGSSRILPQPWQMYHRSRGERQSHILSVGLNCLFVKTLYNNKNIVYYRDLCEFLWGFLRDNWGNLSYLKLFLRPYFRVSSIHCFLFTIDLESTSNE